MRQRRNGFFVLFEDVDDLVIVEIPQQRQENGEAKHTHHAQQLEDMGLGVPMMTRVFNRLRAMGADISDPVYTIEQAKTAILKAKGVR